TWCTCPIAAARSRCRTCSPATSRWGSTRCRSLCRRRRPARFASSPPPRRRDSPELPDTPTIDETVPGVINVGWNGLLAPAGTPAPIIDKLNAAAVAALKMPDIVAKMKLQGLHPLSSTPAEFASLLVSEVDHWAKVIPSIGIQPE